MEYYTYILSSEQDGSYYIGHTNNLESRLKRHNMGHNRSTKSKRPWLLIWHNTFSTRSEAMRYERKLKNKKSRKLLSELMEKEGHWHRA